MEAQYTFPVIDMAGTGRRIKKRRCDAGLSVSVLQRQLGLESVQAIYKWERGESLPTVDNLLALARKLGVRMEDLLVYEDREVLFLFESLCAKQPRAFLLLPQRYTIVNRRLRR